MLAETAPAENPQVTTRSLFALLKAGIPMFLAHEAKTFYPKVLQTLSTLHNAGQETSDLEVFFCHQMPEDALQAVITQGNYREIATQPLESKDWHRTPQMFPAQSLNPQNLDWTKIPPGSYCYHGLIPNGTNAQGLPRMKMAICPYHVSKTFNGVEVPWCSFLAKGGTEGSLKHGQTPEEAEADYQKLLAHFGSAEAMEKELPLFLLFDQCKECGINDWDEDCGVSVDITVGVETLRSVS